MASSLRLLLRLLLWAVVIFLPASALGQQEAPHGATFRQNSKVMYDTIVERVPAMFRGRVRAKWDAAMADNCVDEVTEEHIYEIAKKLTPSLFLKNTLAIIEEHKTK